MANGVPHIAGLIANGLQWSVLEDRLARSNDLDFGIQERSRGLDSSLVVPSQRRADVSGKIEGKVASVSEEGDLVTDIPFSNWTKLPRENHVRIVVDDEHETFGIHGVDHSQPTMTLIALAEEPHPLRLHLVGDSASMMLGVRAGAPVRVEW